MSVLTRRQYGRLGLLALAAALLITMLVFTPATDAADGITVKTDAGVILLSTGPDAGDNWIRYYENPSLGFDVNTPDYRQFIDVDKCEVTTPTGGVEETPLLIIEPSQQFKDDAGLGLVSNGFGVRTKNNCATSNGQIDTTQSLTFSLANGEGAFFDETYAIDRVEVDVEGKQNARLQYVLNNDAGSGLRDLNPATDNGADAGVGDNLVVVITGDRIPGDETAEEPTKLFTSITFSPVGPDDKALISIEGGGDGAAPIESTRSRLYPGVTQTLFHIVSSQTFDGNLLCNGPQPPASIAPGGPAVPGTTVERLEDLKGTGDCLEDAIPYNFQIRDDYVYFDYLDSKQGAQFVVEIEWAPYDPAVYPSNPPVRQINWIDDSEANYTAGVACLELDNLGNPVHPPDPDAEESDEVVPWCIIGQTLELTEVGWVQIQRWHGQGDPRWK